MKLLIVGSRSFTDYKKMKIVLYNRYSVDQIDEVISGGAQGADTLAQQFAEEHDIKFTEYPAKWRTFGKRAGILRNMNMVNAADEVIAFWDGKSAGTRFTIQYAQEKGKTPYVVSTD